MAVVRTAFLAVCLLFLSLAAPTFGADTGDDLFDQGVSAFKSGDYAAAATYFEQALAAGLDTPALHYNLGASLYKLGRYQEAETTFGAIAGDPVWTALAYYNMALSAHARGALARAREYAEDARRNAGAGEVRALAAALLERLGAGRRSARAQVQVHLGYDSNVTLTADDQTLEATRMSDAFLQLQASADGHFGAGAEAARWEASYFSLNYRDLSENDISQLLLGASRPVEYAGWQWDTGLRWRYLWLDGQGLQQIATLRLDGTRALADQRELRAGAAIATIDAVDSAFDFLEGSRQQLDLALGQPAGNGWVTTGLTWEHNNRADLADGDNFFSFSSSRYGIWVAGSWPLPAAWRLEPFAQYYRARYADPERRAGDSRRTRADQHLELSLRMRRHLSAAWQLLAEYVYIENESNLPDFSYNQRLILLGIAHSL